MKLASDTGPLIALAQIERLDLLKSVFGAVVIPPAVKSEIFAKAGAETELLAESIGSWIQVTGLQPATGRTAAQLDELDLGEREAILLALQIGCPLLIDDRMGRAAARAVAVPITGVAGFLVSAKKRGLIPAVLPLLAQMRERGYWLSDELLEVVSRLAEE